MGTIKRINPDLLLKNPAFSQIVITQGGGKTIYIGGQNSINADGEIIGKGDLQAQTRQTMQNIDIALKACGATFENLVKLSIYIVQGQNLLPAFQASQEFLKNSSQPPAVTVHFVSALVNPDFLLEIEAIAFIPD